MMKKTLIAFAAAMTVFAVSTAAYAETGNKEDGIELEVSTEHGTVFTVRVPVTEENEEFSCEVADEKVMSQLTPGENTGKQFAVSFLMNGETETETSAMITGYVGDEIEAEYKLEVKPMEDSDGSDYIATVILLNNDEAQEVKVGLVNDSIYDVDEEEMTVKTGIDLPAPEKAEEITFNVITASAEFPIAEMDCVYDGHEISERAQQTQVVKLDETTAEEDYNISGYFYEWDKIEKCEVNARAGVICSCKDATVIAWLDVVPGIMYTMAVPEQLEADTMVELAETFFVPMQGDC